MDVTLENFEEMLPRVEKAIEECVFFSMDAEMTGIQAVDPGREDVLDDPEQRYARVKQSAQSFLIMQLGLSMFELDEEGCYTAQTFNFYVFPRSYGNWDSRFTSQASSLEFLKNHNFDFNKFIYSGIPYLSFTQQQQFHKGKQKAEDKKQQPIVLTDESDLAFLQQQMARVQCWLQGPQQADSCCLPPDAEENHRQMSCPVDHACEELLLEPCNSYLRAVMYQELEKRYGKKYFHAEVLQSKLKTRLSSLKLTKGSADSIAAQEAEMVVEKQRLYSRAVGFGHVVKLLVSCKKPVVGHNLFTDVCFFYQQFIAHLPPTFAEFGQKIISLFPGGVYDTKYLARTVPNVFPPARGTSLEEVYTVLSNFQCPASGENEVVKVNSTALSTIAPVSSADIGEATIRTSSGATDIKEQDGRVLPSSPEGIVAATECSLGVKLDAESENCIKQLQPPKVRHGKDFIRYQSESFNHEAGYDAFITGASFVWLSKLLEARPGTHLTEELNQQQVLIHSVQQYANRLFMRSSDIPYLPLNGEHVIPDRTTVFRVAARLQSLPPAHEIFSRLAGLGMEITKLIWLNPSTCYVKLKEHTQVSNFIPAVESSNWGVTVVPYHVIQETRVKILSEQKRRKASLAEENMDDLPKWPRREADGDPYQGAHSGVRAAAAANRSLEITQLWWADKSHSGETCD